MKKEDIGQFIGTTSKALIEGATGIVSTDKKELMKSAGQLLQQFRGGHFLEELKQTWDEYREKGRVKPDYQETDQCWDNLKEILEAIDQDMPDRIRFEAMKAVFINSAQEEFYDRNSLLPYEFMKITRRLSSCQILILSACYSLCKNNDERNFENFTSYSKWANTIKDQARLEYREIVDFEEKGLVDAGLISGRKHGDGSGILSKNFRLTDLGLSICEFISKEELVE